MWHPWPWSLAENSLNCFKNFKSAALELDTQSLFYSRSIEYKVKDGTVSLSHLQAGKALRYPISVWHHVWSSERLQERVKRRRKITSGSLSQGQNSAFHRVGARWRRPSSGWRAVSWRRVMNGKSFFKVWGDQRCGRGLASVYECAGQLKDCEDHRREFTFPQAHICVAHPPTPKKWAELMRTGPRLPAPPQFPMH